MTVSPNKQEQVVLKPQDGFQVQFLSSTADIVIGGAAAGVGKTWGLLLAPLRHKDVRRFNCITFRRTIDQIRNPEGLWYKSTSIYPYFGFKQSEQHLEWYRSTTNVTLKFGGLQYEKDVYNHDGPEYCLICFDELQHFSEKMFFYLLSRNRSTCGVRPYVMATCNPDPDSFLARLLEWWIDQNEKYPAGHPQAGEKNPEWGYPIKERIGVLRYLIKHEDKYVWGNSKDELIRNNPDIFNAKLLARVADPHDLIKSVTLITGKLEENKALLAINPGYYANLMAQDEVERLRLLEGNWKVRGKDTCIFNQFSIENMFENNFPASTNERYITCDAARFGQDLCTIFVWYGWRVTKLIVLSKSDAQEIIDAIEKERNHFSIIKGHVIVDQDGVGGGVVRGGRYIGFSGNSPVFEEPGTFIKENYQNLKTQFYYRFADKVNEDYVSLHLSNENVVIDGEHSCKIKLNGQVYDVRELIKQDMRAVRRKDADKDGKKKINGKDEQKMLLNGRSPDFSDGMMLRVHFDFRSGKIKTAAPPRKKSLLDYI